MKEKDQSHAWPTLGSLKQRWAKLDELLSLCQISLHFPWNNRRSFRNFPRASSSLEVISFPSKSECYASDPINQDRNVLRAFYGEEEEEKEKEKEEEEKEEEKTEKEERRRRRIRNIGICKAVGGSPNAGTDARRWPSRANLPPLRRRSS